MFRLPNRFAQTVFAVLLLVPAGELAALSASVEIIPGRTGGGGELTVFIGNTGDAPVTLAPAPNWGAGGGLSVEVASPTGHTTALAAEAEAPAQQITLEPGASMGVSRRLDQGTFAIDGTHVVVVRYAVPHGEAITASAKVTVGD
jgi:hypothetical protein